MMSRRNPFGRFIASRSAVAGIEFAMILPVLLVLLLAFYDGGRALSIYNKTRFATTTLAQLTNQYVTIHDADLTTILSATSKVLAPYSATPATATVSEISIDAKGKVTLSWSNVAAGTLPNVPAALVIPSTCLIYSQVSYKYTPAFKLFSSIPITMSDSIFVSPRNSACISRVSP
jgi:Flp pilus assembly protein TadG